MSGMLASVVGKRILAESARNRFGHEDPYFEEVPASRLGRAFGKKTQKRRKAVPPGLSEHDAEVLTKVKRRAYRLDYSLFNLCGVQFGWGSVIGIIPFAGDVGDAALALMVINSCGEVEGGIPSHLRMKMMINLIIDFIVGLVPFLGDIVDGIFKANTRNAVILEKHLREKGAREQPKQKKQQDARGVQDTGGVDMSLPDEFDRNEHGVVDTNSGMEMPTKPGRAQQPQGTRTEQGWFGGSNQRIEDLERGGA